MIDEHLMRQWADAHSEFSSGLDRGLQRLGRLFTTRRQDPGSIGTAYAPASCAAVPAKPEVSGTARAALAGVTACVATSALLFTVALLATADMHSAAAYPIMTHTIVA